jgi:hypothetical protein
MKCPNDNRKNCEAYKLNWGNECWFISNEIVKNCYYFAKKYGSCLNCPWYKKNNSIKNIQK